MTIETFISLWFIAAIALFISCGMMSYAFIKGLFTDNLENAIRFLLYGVLSIELAFITFLPILISILNFNVR